jgi:plastocyanin
MSRRVATWLVLLLALGASVGATGAQADHHVYPARLLVYAQEWSLSPSRATLPAGRVVVQLWNRGMDPHDLRARRLVGGRMVGHTFAVHLTLPGRVSTATWTLPPGRYQLYCSLPGHMKAGMHVQITVRRRS